MTELPELLLTKALLHTMLTKAFLQTISLSSAGARGSPSASCSGTHLPPRSLTGAAVGGVSCCAAGAACCGSACAMLGDDPGSCSGCNC